MSERVQYKKRPNFHVSAVQIDLDCDGFSYNKWGNQQKCRAGDWLVNNGGDTYTVTKEYFREFYQAISPGQYEKVGAVWAEAADKDGAIKTHEGSTDYSAGDYLVFDRPTGGSAYAIKKHNFERMYEAVIDSTVLSHAQKKYIDTRLTSQINFYDRNAFKNRIQYHTWQALTIISAALVPIFSSIELNNTSWIMGFFGGTTSLIAFLGGASAVFAGILSLFKFQENWVKFRATCEDLRSHYAQFSVNSGIYAEKETAFETLVENTERIIGAERGQWVQQNSPKKEEAAATT